MIGIYCYQDTFNENEIVYIGKDSNIHRNARDIAHNSPSRYNEQQINRVLQNNSGRYKYKVLKHWLKEKYSCSKSTISRRLQKAREIRGGGL